MRMLSIRIHSEPTSEKPQAGILPARCPESLSADNVGDVLAGCAPVTTIGEEAIAIAGGAGRIGVDVFGAQAVDHQVVPGGSTQVYGRLAVSPSAAADELACEADRHIIAHFEAARADRRS